MGNLPHSWATTISSESEASKITTINADLIMHDNMIAGTLAVSTTGGTRTLFGTPANAEAQNMFFDVTGVLASNAIIEIPVAAGTGRNRIYVVKNGTTGAFTLTVRKVGGTGVTVGQGNTGFLLYNGTDIAYAAPQIVSATGSLAPVSITAIWARVYHSANQSILNNTLTALAFDSERVDTDTIHDTATNNSRLTCKTAGVYSISGTAEYANNVTGNRELAVRLNGTTYIAAIKYPAATLLTSLVVIETKYALVVNDYVELIAFQDSGGALNVTASANYSAEFMMARLGA